MWQSSNTIRIGQDAAYSAPLPGGQYARGQGVYPCLSPCDRCKEPERVMVGLAENIQACLRIFRRAQHLWLVRDILHQPQGVFDVIVLWHT